jgi:hypothetical protein
MESAIMQNYAGKNNNGNAPVSIDDLAAATIYKGKKSKSESFDAKDAREVAEHVLNFFKPGIDRIIDNSLEPEDRDVFYALEDLDLLDTDREDTHLHDGREWKINYWLINRVKIKEVAQRAREEQSQQVPREEDPFNYENLSDEIWSCGKSIKSFQG